MRRFVVASILLAAAGPAFQIPRQFLINRKPRYQHIQQPRPARSLYIDGRHHHFKQGAVLQRKAFRLFRKMRQRIAQCVALADDALESEFGARSRFGLRLRHLGWGTLIARDGRVDRPAGLRVLRHRRTGSAQQGLRL